DTFYTDYREATTILYVPPVIPTAPDNLALNAPTVTGGSASGNAKLTDGDRVSYWQPSSGERAGSNVWFYVDLGAQKNFNSTQLYITKDSKKIIYYEILYAKTESIGNNQTWVRAALVMGDPKSENIQTFANVTGRFIKINIGLQDAATNIHVGELEVYNR
ncbi:MAG: discoidin domain-containing protein, partial [Ginsengibacter sp.]